MKNEMMSSGKGKRKITLDPRTKLALLLMVATFVLGGAGGNELIWARILLAIIPAILLLFSGKVKAFFVFEMLFLAGCLLQYYLLGKLSGFFNFLVLATAGILSQFIPGLMMGYYTVTTTTVSEFVAAMERMHMPKQIVIPLSVMFRFFPTVGEEASSISDAMRMREISFGGNHPGKMLEYRLIPLMTCSVKIGDELSAAALTRGLGADVKRTNICKIGFRFVDYIVLLGCIITLAYLLLVKIGGFL